MSKRVFHTDSFQAENNTHVVGVEKEEVGRASIRKFALAVADMNPLYVDREAAIGGSYGDVVAPPTLVCETGQYYRGEIDEEGGFLDRVNLPLGQEIRAGKEYTFHKPVRPDTVITARFAIRDIYEREGHTGRLLFVITDIAYTDQRGESLAENHETLAYRLRAAKPSSKARS